MKEFENNWRQKSLENLERDVWRFPPKDTTPLVERVYKLRTIQIENLEPSDLRFLIRQKIGLKYLIPIALDVLQNNIFIETEFYNGDLLQSLLLVDEEFWEDNNTHKEDLDNLLSQYSKEDKEEFKDGKFEKWI
jgi:hypothetical protein